ncbi:STAS domain-containing protein [Aurantiacibacter xanthus]|uniref:STAS domain-containing protein n=1 Tax=Aurantiacibacter xanthus TaxID=1784712 RepID=A0A3A1P2U8_9SPHN|nr:STAS domain-containing protein [Aurantiacibacter xanthus]RIV80120.1 STAS domain-containing protein [Aurantiacibacter xanthus]
MADKSLGAPCALNVRTVSAFADQLLADITNFSSVELDLTECEELDLAALQAISAARIHAADTGKTLSLSQPAHGALRSVLDRAGFTTDPSPADVDFWFHGESPQ